MLLACKLHCRELIQAAQQIVGASKSSDLTSKHPITTLPPEMLNHTFELGTEEDPASFPTLVSQGQLPDEMDFPRC